MLVQDDGYCFVCGSMNPFGLKVLFCRSEGKITAEFTPSRACQGYKDVTHGGIITALLDEAMIHAAMSEGCTPVTAEILVRFRSPLPVHESAVVEAEVTKRGGRLIEARSRLVRTADLSVVAEASAKLIPT